MIKQGDISMTSEEIALRLRGRRPDLMDVTRSSAVLVPLVETSEGTALLFEVRADTLSSQPGEVCFPGGRMEPGETPTDCALRETWEELGIPPEQVEPVCELDRLWQHSASALIYPVLGRVDPACLSALDPQPGEVKEVFTVPLEFFLNTEPVRCTYELAPRVGPEFPYSLIGFPGGYPWRSGKTDVTIYPRQDQAIWGLTGRIVRHLVTLLQPPQHGSIPPQT